jgi:tocopherol cyclase
LSNFQVIPGALFSGNNPELYFLTTEHLLVSLELSSSTESESMTSFRFTLPFVLALILLLFLFVSCGDEDSSSDVSAEEEDDDTTGDVDDDNVDDDIADDDDDDQWPGGDPNRYHWDGQANPFYEGWFFRIALPDGRSFAFIYCIQNPGDATGDMGGAYLVAARSGGDLFQETFEAAAFSGNPESFAVQIADHSATEGHLDGEVHENSHDATWDIDYEIIEPWTDTMGDFTNQPDLPVNWYVGALRGRAGGVIEWDGEVISFTDAAVFQDHNWGDFFPSGYIWMQSQEFPDAGDAVAVAGGAVGLMEAGMFVWRHGDELVEIRSQDFNAQFDFSSNFENDQVAADIRSEGRRYLVTGFFDDDIPSILPAPMPEGFLPYTRMALAGRICVQAFIGHGNDWELVEEVWSDNAGVEIGGAYGPPIGEK